MVILYVIGNAVGSISGCGDGSVRVGAGAGSVMVGSFGIGVGISRICVVI